MLAGLETVSTLRGVKFAYAVSKNKNTIQQEIASLRESHQPSEEYIKFDNARMALCENHCRREENGKPALINDREYDIIDRPQFDIELEKLRGEHEAAVKEHEQGQREYEKFLDEESEIKLHMVTLSDLPTDITAQQLDSINMMVIDE